MTPPVDADDAAPDVARQLVLDGAEPPAALRALAARLAPGSALTPLWRNELGGWTVRLDPGTAPARSAQVSLVLKWVPAATRAAWPDEPSLADEARRLEWLAGRHPAPELVAAGVSDDGDEHLLTRALTGESAVTERWRAEPRLAVRVLGESLRALHESLSAADCPFPCTAPLGPALPTDPEPRASDRVVAHGDACAPNTLLDARGAFLAHVDVGALGVGDRWLDLAAGAQSLAWNYGPGFESLYFAAYGVDPDEERLAAWRRRWNHD